MQLRVHLLVVRRIGFCAKGRVEGGNDTVQILAGIRSSSMWFLLMRLHGAPVFPTAQGAEAWCKVMCSDFSPLCLPTCVLLQQRGEEECSWVCAGTCAVCSSVCVCFGAEE